MLQFVERDGGALSHPRPSMVCVSRDGIAHSEQPRSDRSDPRYICKFDSHITHHMRSNPDLTDLTPDTSVNSPHHFSFSLRHHPSPLLTLTTLPSPQPAGPRSLVYLRRPKFMPPFFSLSLRGSFGIQKVLAMLNALYLGWTSPHSLTEGHEYRPIIPRATEQEAQQGLYPAGRLGHVCDGVAWTTIRTPILEG